MTNPLTLDRARRGRRARAALGTVVAAALLAAATPAATAAPRASTPTVRHVADGPAQGSGTAIGPDGALYLTDGPTGRVLRMDRDSGDVTTVASGLPQALLPVGGPVDVAFVDDTAYVLVTLVGSDVGGTDTVGVYRLDGPTSATVVADLGAFGLANPPATDIFVPTGVHHSLEAFRGGLVVTDAHHNRILRVTLDGDVTEVVTLDNVVPTGTEVRGNRIHVALAGPVPHEAADGRVMVTDGSFGALQEVASGAPLAVDVERGRGRTLFALAQGDFPDGAPDGAPALPDTGQLLHVRPDGGMDVVVDGLDQPTSMEVVGTTAWVVGLDGAVVRVDGLAGRPFGRGRAGSRH